VTVLIVTHSEDNDSVQRVMDAIEAQGGHAFRFDTDRFPTEIQLRLEVDARGERARIEAPHGTVDLRQVSAVWYRRANIGAGLPADMDAELRRVSRLESRRVVMGMIAALDAFHLDLVQSIRQAEHKQLQLQLARALGLEVPRTLTTNSPEAVRTFAATCPEGIVTKMLASFSIHEDGEEKAVFTSAVRPEDLDDLGGLRLCPMTFQERIPKQLELRVTVVGERVFAAAVDSQALGGARDDWRREGEALLDAWKPYTLPREVETRLLRLHARFGLSYGASDFILTPSGQLVFLELNPAGEFFWLERAPGFSISKALADVLLGHGRQRTVE
jgi:MvdD family ATP-grasp ribosomal peptide maturase